MKKRIQIDLTETDIQLLKIAAANQNRTIKNMAEAIIKSYIDPNFKLYKQEEIPFIPLQ